MNEEMASLPKGPGDCDSMTKKLLTQLAKGTHAKAKRFSVTEGLALLQDRNNNDENVLPEYPYDPILDDPCKEKVVLRRYHDIFRVFVVKKLFKKLDKLFTEESVGNDMQTTIVDYSVSYAYQGAQCFEEYQTNLQYVVLQAALILTITFEYYVDPGLSDKTLNHLFSFLLGFSALAHIICIIAATISTGAINMAYSDIDAYYFKILLDTMGQTLVIQSFNYLGIMTALAGLLVAGFDRSSFDCAVIAILTIPTVIGLFYFFAFSIGHAAILQDERTYLFYKKYCEADGQLSPKYRDKLFEKEEDDMKKVLKVLENINEKLDLIR